MRREVADKILQYILDDDRACFDAYLDNNSYYAYPINDIDAEIVLNNKKILIVSISVMNKLIKGFYLADPLGLQKARDALREMIK